MKCFSKALLPLVLVLPLAGCGGSVDEVAPPSTAPEMTAEEKSNYEKQMEMMKQQRSPKKAEK